MKRPKMFQAVFESGTIYIFEAKDLRIARKKAKQEAAKLQTTVESVGKFKKKKT